MKITKLMSGTSPQIIENTTSGEKLLVRATPSVTLAIHRMSSDEFRTLKLVFSENLSPFGKMVIASSPKGICYVSFGENGIEEMYKRFPFAHFEIKNDPIHQDALVVVKEWKNSGFSSTDSVNTSALMLLNEIKQPLSLHIYGTDFQQAIWHQLLQIPFGQQSTYRKISENARHPKAFRATGTAIGQNPIALFIPCHRVITSSGKPGGYRWGKELKEKLLMLEKKKS